MISPRPLHRFWYPASLTWHRARWLHDMAPKSFVSHNFHTTTTENTSSLDTERDTKWTLNELLTFVQWQREAQLLWIILHMTYGIATDHCYRLCSSKMLLHKRCSLSMVRGNFWPHSTEIWWPIALKLKFKKAKKCPGDHVTPYATIGWDQNKGVSEVGQILSLSHHQFYPFLYSCHAVPVRPLDRMWRLTALNAQFWPRKCL